MSPTRPYLAFVIAFLLANVVRADVDPDTEIAQRRYRKGVEYYEAKDYPKAVVEFEAARRIKPLPALDFNIGRAYDRMDDPARAVEAYERYLAAAPIAPDAAEVRDRVRVLRERMETQRPATSAPEPVPPQQVVTPPIAPPQEPPPGEKRPSLIAPVAVGALALGSLVVGSVLVGTTYAEYGSLERSCGTRCAPPSWEGLPARLYGGDALLAIGAAAAVADGVLWYLWLRDRRAPARVVVAPTLGGLVAGGSF